MSTIQLESTSAFGGDGGGGRGASGEIPNAIAKCALVFYFAHRLPNGTFRQRAGNFLQPGQALPSRTEL